MKSGLKFIPISICLILLNYPITQSFITESQCSPQNVTIFYEGTKNSIESFRHVSNGRHQSGSLPKINTNSHVYSMTYDPFNREILFVEKDFPTKIQSVNSIINPHFIIEHQNIVFKEIAIDTTTSNIYYINQDNYIGVCAGREKRAKCTQLLEKQKECENEKTDLLLHPKKGLIFWISHEAIDGKIEYTIKMAGMDGQNVRELKNFKTPYSISIDEKDNTLFVVDKTSITRLSLNLFSSQIIKNSLPTTGIHYFNCELYFYGFNGIKKIGKNERLQSVFSTRANNLLLVVSDEKLAFDSNPCKEMQCLSHQICVLSKPTINLEAKCIELNQNNNIFNKTQQNSITTQLPSKINEKTQNSSSNEFLTKTFILSLFLNTMFIFVLIARHFNLWPKIRKHLFNKRNATGQEARILFKETIDSDDL